MTTSEAADQLHVRFFSMLREVVGNHTIMMALDKPESVRTVLDRIIAHHPEIGPYRGSLRAAVNQEYVDESFTVFNGDELAIITPVSGG